MNNTSLGSSSYFDFLDVSTNFSLCHSSFPIKEVIQVMPETNLTSWSLEQIGIHYYLFITATILVTIYYLDNHPTSPVYTLKVSYPFTYYLAVNPSCPQTYHTPCLKLEDCFYHLLSSKLLYCNFHFLIVATPHSSTKGVDAYDYFSPSCNHPTSVL